MENPNYGYGEKPYKSKYICTRCRKSFKRKILADLTTDKNIEEKEPTCPDCGNSTSWIGPKFRAPKTDNIKAWNSIKALHDIGVLNFIGWANVPIRIPETKKALDDVLMDIKAKYEYSIQKWITGEYRPDSKDQIKYFSDAVKQIDKYLRTK